MGPVVHGSPGCMAGTRRSVSFLAALLPGGVQYDSNFQLQAWSWSNEAAFCQVLNVRHAVEWADYEPAKNYVGKEASVR